MSAPPSTGLARSPLVQCLASLGITEPPPATATLAERWSPWLGWADAISLSAMLNAGVTAPAAPSRHGVPARAVALARECDRLRDELAQAITDDPAFAPDADLSVWRGPYQAQQRAMDGRIGALRAELRAALTATSPALARLAALDATLERALAARERQLLGTVPTLLHTPVTRARQTQAGGAWLQQALHAELDHRWQAIAGLLEALGTTPALSA